MAIDEPNTELKEADKSIYKELGLPTSPFDNVTYYYPFGKGDNVQSYASKEDIKAQMDSNRAYVYKFTFEKSLERLDLLLANEDDSTGTLESCVNFVINQSGPFNGIDKWSSFKDALDNNTKALERLCDKLDN